MSIPAPRTVSGRCSECGGELTLIEKEYPGDKLLKHPYFTCKKCGAKQGRPRKVRQKDLRKNPNEPSSFKFQHKYTRSFHYPGDDGEPKEIKVSIDLPVEIHIEKRFKLLKKPSFVDGKIIIGAPVSGEEVSIDWKKATEASGGTAEKRSASVKDSVGTYIGVVSMWKELAKQIRDKKIDAPTAFRKQSALLGFQSQFPDLSPYAERELELFDPVTDARLHGIVVRYGDPNLKETLERFPSDWKIMSMLGVKSDYGRRAIVRTFGISLERFLNLWKDADNRIEALDQFKKSEEKRLTESPEFVKDAALDMVATMKVSVKKQKDEQRQWQNNQLNKIWKTMFPTSVRPTSDWEAVRLQAGA